MDGTVFYPSGIDQGYYSTSFSASVIAESLIDWKTCVEFVIQISMYKKKTEYKIFDGYNSENKKKQLVYIQLPKLFKRIGCIWKLANMTLSISASNNVCMTQL